MCFLHPVFYAMLVLVVVLASVANRVIYTIALAILFGLAAYLLQLEQFKALGVMVGWFEPLPRGVGTATNLLVFVAITRAIRRRFMKRRSIV